MEALTDELFQQRMGRFRSHLEELRDESLIILKGHLLIEELLNEVLCNYCNQPEVFPKLRLSFFNKVLLCQALAGGKDLGDYIWTLLYALNTARNKLAHGLDDTALQSAIECFLGSAEDSFVFVSQSETTSERLALGISAVFGYLSGHEHRQRLQRGSEGQVAPVANADE